MISSADARQERVPGREVFFAASRAAANFSQSAKFAGGCAGRVRLLQGLELPLQLPERKRKTELRRNKQGLNEKNGAEEDQDPGNEQGKPKPRPAFSSRIGKNKRRDRVRRILFHWGHIMLRE